MASMIGLINLEHENDQFKELTYHRPIASIPFAGRYRLIDFTLSNMVQSQIHEVAIFTQNKYRSLIGHLGSGADWELNKTHGGLFLFPPQAHHSTNISQGDVGHFYYNRDFFENSSAEYVLISGSQFVANLNYLPLFHYHLETGADVTLLTTQHDIIQELKNCLKLELDKNNKVIAITNDKQNQETFCGVYLLHKSLLLELVDECVANHKSYFFWDGIRANLEKLHIAAYHYDGYHSIIHDVAGYFRQSMKLIKPENYRQLFRNYPPVFTKVSNHPPTRYQHTAIVKDSLIATGALIEGTVENSILFRGVKVKKGAVVRNSIIMQDGEISADSQLENVILDKQVVITKNQMLKGSIKHPYIIEKKSII